MVSTWNHATMNLRVPRDLQFVVLRNPQSKVQRTEVNNRKWKMRQSSSEILLEMESDCTQSLSLINKYSLTPSGSLIVVICLVTNGSFLPVSDNRDNFCIYIFKELLASKRGSHREWFCTATCKASANCVAIRLNTYHTRGNHQKHSHSNCQQFVLAVAFRF